VIGEKGGGAHRDPHRGRRCAGVRPTVMRGSGNHLSSSGKGLACEGSNVKRGNGYGVARESSWVPFIGREGGEVAGRGDQWWLPVELVNDFGFDGFRGEEVTDQ
jgi:hypothetical protein